MGRTLAVWRKQYLTRFDTDRASDGPTEAVTWGLPWPEPEVTEVPVRLEIDQARGMRAEAADVEVEISDPLYHRLVRVDDFELGGTPNLLSTVLIPCRAVAIRIAGAPVPGQPKVATGPARLLHLVPPPPRASSTSCLLHLVPRRRRGLVPRGP